jgi:hypothetical protein
MTAKSYYRLLAAGFLLMLMCMVVLMFQGEVLLTIAAGIMSIVIDKELAATRESW